MSEDAQPSKPCNTSKKKAARRRDWKKAILACVVECGNISQAAEAAGVSTDRVYWHRKTDPQFEADFQEALEMATQNLEQEAFKRAKRGSDKLIEFLLDRRDPKYRGKGDEKPYGNITINVSFERDDEPQAPPTPV
jgi:hypothetical protein